MRKFALFKHEDAELVMEPLRIINVPRGTKVKGKLYSIGATGELYYQETDEWLITPEHWVKWKAYNGSNNRLG